MVVPTLNQRYSTNDRMLRYNRIQCPLFSDTYFAAKKLGPSIRGFHMSQLFATDFGFVGVQNMKKRSELPLALKLFFKEFGVPDPLIVDGAKEQISGEAKRLCQLADCCVQQLQPRLPWSNRAELNIGILKHRI